MAKLTKRQKELREKYTRIAQFDDGYSAYLSIETQEFAISYDVTNEKRAEWYRDMLAIAIDRLLENEKRQAD